jgi:hypothetical protein
MVEIHDHVIRPEPLLDFLPCDDLAVGFDQQSQNIEGLLPEKDLRSLVFASCRAELTCPDIELKFSEPDPTRGILPHS